MPTSHRLACFRDDVVFLIYLYQRWYDPIQAEIVPDLNLNSCPLKAPIPPCSPLQALPSGQNEGERIWSLLRRQAQRQDAQGLKGTDRPSPVRDAVSCIHLNTLGISCLAIQRHLEKYFFLYLVDPVASAPSRAIGVWWTVTTWHRQKFCDKLNCYTLKPTPWTTANVWGTDFYCNVMKTVCMILNGEESCFMIHDDLMTTP